MSGKKTETVGLKSQPGVRVSEVRRIAFTIFQNALVVGVLVFYSKTLLGAAIRGLLSV
jgi:hypothetical protein